MYGFIKIGLSTYQMQEVEPAEMDEHDEAEVDEPDEEISPS